MHESERERSGEGDGGGLKRVSTNLRGEQLEGVPSPVHLHGDALLEQVHVLDVAAPQLVHLRQRQEPRGLATQPRPDPLHLRHLLAFARVPGSRWATVPHESKYWLPLHLSIHY